MISSKYKSLRINSFILKKFYRKINFKKKKFIIIIFFEF
jgi:hypothetical protein